jgi:hypothetical protein
MNTIGVFGQGKIPNHISQILNQTNSGFYGAPDNIYGWKFVELDEGKVANLTERCSGSDNSLCNHSVSYFVNGTALFISSPYYPNIVHFKQVVLGLLHYIHNYHLYPWILNFDYIILPTIDNIRYIRQHSSEHIYNMKVLQMLNYYILYCKKYVINSTNEYDYHDSMDFMTFYTNMQLLHNDTSHMLPKIIFRGKLFDHDGLPLYFKEAVILGTIEMSSPFISSLKEYRIYRLFVSYFIKNDLQCNQKNNMLYMSTNRFLGDTNNNCNNQSINGDYSSHCMEPNKSLKITILLRLVTRKVLNIDKVIKLIANMGFADMTWLSSHILYFEKLTLSQQILIMEHTDILITPHGAGLINLMYMAPYSVVIELYNAMWYEPWYQSTAIALDLHYFVVPVLHIDNIESCEFPVECLHMPMYITRRDSKCYGMRNCNFNVDTSNLEVTLWQSLRIVQIKKCSVDRIRIKRYDVCEYEHCDMYNRKLDNRIVKSYTPSLNRTLT